MTSRLRILIACVVAILAALWGWVTSTDTDESLPISGRGDIALYETDQVEDIDRYVEAIIRSNVFPVAQLHADMDQTESSLTNTAEGLATALADPSLSALIRRGDVWRIHLYAGFEGAQTREVGDQLSDGWIIQAIDATTVLLQRDTDTRLIEVFEAEPDTQ